MKILRVLAILAAGSVASLVRADAPFAVTYEGNVAMVTRDGVTLRADIFRP